MGPGQGKVETYAMGLNVSKVFQVSSIIKFTLTLSSRETQHHLIHIAVLGWASLKVESYIYMYMYLAPAIVSCY